MRRLRISGGKTLSGSIRIGGNKNAALPMIAAAALTDGELVLENMPDILDVHSMLSIAGELGAEYSFERNRLSIRMSCLKSCGIDREMCGKNRTSILFTAPLLNRAGKASLYRPGGDGIGRRRLDGHFYGLTSLGAEMSVTDGEYRFVRRGKRLAGRELFLDEASVTATEQILLAAVLAEGTTTLYNAACEPHVADLAELLNKMGGKISGHGSNTIVIEGVETLHGATHRVASDHIEAGSFIALGAATGSELLLENAGNNRFYWMTRRVFEKLGVRFELLGDRIRIPGGQEMAIRPDFGGYTPVISDGTWPQYPSDMMSCTIVAATQARGSALFFEKMFESRIYFVDRLIAMGANAVVCDPHRVLITGKTPLCGLELSSPDIRAGMAMVIAALTAKGGSVINSAEVIFRGYEDLVGKLQGVGADIGEI